MQPIISCFPGKTWHEPGTELTAKVWKMTASGNWHRNFQNRLHQDAFWELVVSTQVFLLALAVFFMFTIVCQNFSNISAILLLLASIIIVNRPIFWLGYKFHHSSGTWKQCHSGTGILSPFLQKHSSWSALLGIKALMSPTSTSVQIQIHNKDVRLSRVIDSWAGARHPLLLKVEFTCNCSGFCVVYPRWAGFRCHQGRAQRLSHFDLRVFSPTQWIFSFLLQTKRHGCWHGHELQTVEEMLVSLTRHEIISEIKPLKPLESLSTKRKLQRKLKRNLDFLANDRWGVANSTHWIGTHNWVRSVWVCAAIYVVRWRLSCLLLCHNPSMPWRRTEDCRQDGVTEPQYDPNSNCSAIAQDLDVCN